MKKSNSQIANWEKAISEKQDFYVVLNHCLHWDVMHVVIPKWVDETLKLLVIILGTVVYDNGDGRVIVNYKNGGFF